MYLLQASKQVAYVLKRNSEPSEAGVRKNDLQFINVFRNFSHHNSELQAYQFSGSSQLSGLGASAVC